jgi:PKD repeat protein
MKRLLIALAVLPLLFTGCVKDSVTPLASFSISSLYTTISVDDIISFNNTSTNATSFYWTFGDGGYSYDTNPTYYYTSKGTYTVTLTSYNGSSSSTVSTTIDVYGADLVVTVEDMHYNSISGATVSLYTTLYDWTYSSNLYATGTTNANGQVEFYNVDPISYYVDAYSASYYITAGYAYISTLTPGYTNYFTAYVYPYSGKKDASSDQVTARLSVTRGSVGVPQTSIVPETRKKRVK